MDEKFVEMLLAVVDKAVGALVFAVVAVNITAFVAYIIFMAMR